MAGQFNNDQPSPLLMLIVNNLKTQHPGLNLLVWSLLGIYSQLAFVRMFTTFAGGTSYYGNLFLLIGVISLAGGFFAQKLSRYVLFLPYFILMAFMGVLWLSTYNLIPHISGEFLWSTVANTHPKPATFDHQLAILLLSITIIPVMVLIGSQQAHYILTFQKGFAGYLVMSSGAMLGAVVFSLQNQFLPEFLWLASLWTGLLLLLLMLVKTTAFQKTIALIPMVFFLVSGGTASYDHQWSPYQRINLVKSDDPFIFDILSNGFYISSVSAEPVANMPLNRRQLQSWVFKCIDPEDHVLILGSCGGTSDVREALYAGAGKVTAVEIDPCFVRIGTMVDPDKSYMDQRVRTVIGDARRFMMTDSGRYDMIYLAFLDSQTNASNKARFRLDSFLYTKEGIELILSHLKKDGLLYLNFATGTNWIRNRMHQMLKASTAGHVRVFQRQSAMQTLYVVSEQKVDLSYLENAYKETTSQFEKYAQALIPTDDWPFFYSINKTVPLEHLRLLVMMLILMIAVLSICQNIGGIPSATAPEPGRRLFLLTYAFLSGAAFFFIELRTISALTPILGSSYKSQAFVVIAIILSSLLGNLSATFKLKINITAAWAILFISLGAAFMSTALFHPLRGVLLPSVVLYTALYIFPTFIAGYLYLYYLIGQNSHTVLSMQKWNFFGGALGGLGEVSVILFGFQRSLWIVVVLYLLAFFSTAVYARGKRGVSSVVPSG